MSAFKEIARLGLAVPPYTSLTEIRQKPSSRAESAVPEPVPPTPRSRAASSGHTSPLLCPSDVLISQLPARAVTDMERRGECCPTLSCYPLENRRENPPPITHSARYTAGTQYTFVQLVKGRTDEPPHLRVHFRDLRVETQFCTSFHQPSHEKGGKSDNTSEFRS